MLCDILKVRKFMKTIRKNSFQFIGPTHLKYLPRFTRDIQGYKDEFKIITEDEVKVMTKREKSKIMKDILFILFTIWMLYLIIQFLSSIDTLPFLGILI